jgi:hypothetical protein
VDAEEGPHRREAAEELVPGEAIPAVDALGLGGRQEHRDVVAALGVAGRVHLSPDGADQQPLERLVAGPPQVGGHARPVEVHVDAERGRVRVRGEAALLVHDLREGETAAPELARHRAGEVARLLQLVEVLGEEPVVTIVARGARREALEHGVGKDGHLFLLVDCAAGRRMGNDRAGRAARDLARFPRDSPAGAQSRMAPRASGDGVG